MKELRQLSSILADVQDKVIGVADVYGNKECVIEKDNSTVTTIRIGTFLGLHQSTYNAESVNVIRFPQNKTLGEMMNSPFELHDWWNETFKDK